MTIRQLTFTHLQQSDRSARFGWRFGCGMALDDRSIRGAEWGIEFGDRLSNAFKPLAQAVHPGAVRRFANFDRFVYGVDRPLVGHQLDGLHPRQRSGRYRSAIPL
jgi:hypothetical protein